MGGCRDNYFMESCIIFCISMKGREVEEGKVRSVGIDNFRVIHSICHFCVLYFSNCVGTNCEKWAKRERKEGESERRVALDSLESGR